MSGLNAKKLFAKFSVVGGYDWFKPASPGGIRKERGERRLVVNQQQARLSQFALLSPRRPACAASARKVKRMKRLFNRSVHKVPIWRDFRAET